MLLLFVFHPESRLKNSLPDQERSPRHLHQSSSPPPPEQQHHQSFSAVEAPEHTQHCEDDEEEEEEESSSGVEQERPQPSVVKKEQQRSHGDFWMDHDEHEHLDNLESDIKDFMSSSSGLRSSLQDPHLSFHPSYIDHSNGEENKERPYCCSVCEKRFSNSSHLAAHIRTHTGERPYRCEICRKTFITTSALNRHQTIHTEGKRFICNYCGKTFKWMESLGRHIRSVHKRDNQPE